jgi:hypothetical protein
MAASVSMLLYRSASSHSGQLLVRITVIELMLEYDEWLLMKNKIEKSNSRNHSRNHSSL